MSGIVRGRAWQSQVHCRQEELDDASIIDQTRGRGDRTSEEVRRGQLLVAKRQAEWLGWCLIVLV